MKPLLTALVVLAIAVAPWRELTAGENRTVVRGAGKSAAVAIRPRRSSGYFAYPSYPNAYYYPTYYPPVLVVSPYFQPYYLTPTVVVTSPYFCALHNAGFVSRIGLLDHLSGMHKVPLDAAAAICPDGPQACIFPSY